jgi:hypothetical protein
MFGRADDVFETSAPAAAGFSGYEGGVGESPDGLGAHAVPMPEVHPSAHYGAQVPMAGKLEFLEPGDTSPQAALRSAGLTALAAAVTFGTGLALGGPWGGISGVAFSASAFNVYRAQKWWGSADASEKHEAVVSAIFGTINIVVGGYTAYRAYQSRDKS